jgi:hypothetical protein
MRASTTQYLFQHVYAMAALVEECIENDESLGELEWEDAEFLRRLSRSSKSSILHHYIYAMISVVQSRDYRKNADLYDLSDAEIIEQRFKSYGIDCLAYKDFVSPIHPDESTSRQEDPFYQWFLSQIESFELLWERLTDEVFHLLFANRSFLLKFNLAVARHLESGAVDFPIGCLTPSGRIKRQQRFPRWLQKAVFYRDHGRCVLCQVDLSGLLSTDRSDHLDHIVSLARWGTNDPCNIQLLCQTCNLRKAAGEPVTGNRYSSWWPS